MASIKTLSAAPSRSSNCPVRIDQRNGAIMIANRMEDRVVPGSMGKAFPGVRAAIARRWDGTVEVLDPGEVGEIVLMTGWPSMFKAYLDDEARYRKCFAEGWYFSGDQARLEQAAGHVVAMHLGHPDVQEGNLGPELTGEGERLGAVVGDE